MKLLWLPLFIISFAILLLPARPVRAQRITLAIESTTTVHHAVDTRILVKNTGAEPAFEISVRATFLGQERTAWVARSIPPGGSEATDIRFQLPPDARGTFPIFGHVTYESQRGTSFSAAMIAVVRTILSPGSDVSVNLTRNAYRGESELYVELLDSRSALKEAELTCHLSDELMASRRAQKVAFRNGKAYARFLIKNDRGSEGSVYVAFVAAEYDLDGIHYLAYSNLPIPLEKPMAGGKTFIPSWHQTLLAMGILLFGGVVSASLSAKMRQGFQAAFNEKAWPQKTLDVAALLLIEVFIFSHLSPQDLLTDTTTTGGDTASHYYTLHYLRHELLPKGRISGWAPGNYAGFPILQFYFPLPFLLMCGLGLILPLQVAFKWGSLVGTFLLPIAAYLMIRLMKGRFPGPAIGAALTLPFLFNTGNSMWGGNILSTLAGEFSYSLSFAVSLIFLGSLFRGCTENRWVTRNAFLVFLVGFSHGFTLLFVEVVSLFFLITPRGFLRRLAYLLKVYTLGFLLLAFWLVPLLAFMRYTTAQNLLWHLHTIKELVPLVMLPVLALAVMSSIGILVREIASHGLHRKTGLSILGFLWFGIFAAGFMFVAGPEIGVVDIRFAPFAQLMACLLGAIGLGLFGEMFHKWGLKWAYLLLVLGLTIGWTNSRVEMVPQWSKWEYEGFEVKPDWVLYSRINDALRGGFQDPRVVFEHSDRHNVFGTTRAFESLPLFAGRATLEGVYNQASITAPFIFYVQSLVSQQKSCPFKLYACGDMDFDRARRRLEMFNVRDIILRSPEAKSAIRTQSGYSLRGTLDDYEIWEIEGHRAGYVVPLQYEPLLYATRDWKMDAYEWFMYDDLEGVHLAFVANPSTADRERFRATTDSLRAINKFPIDTTACIIKETIRNEEILIETNWINKPLLVRVSYHPNWHVEGADHVYLVSPSFMLIYPRDSKVRLYYRPGLPDKIGFLLSVFGLTILMLNVPIPGGDSKKTVWLLMAGHFGIPVSLKQRLKWDPSSRTRWRILVTVLLAGTLTAGWSGYQIYRGQPNRLFNESTTLKDAKRFEEARQGFRTVMRGSSPLSDLALDSAYYIAICYYMEGDNEKAIDAFESLIRAFPFGKRTQEASYHIGLCYFRMGKEEQGVQQMHLVRSRYPGSTWGNFARDRLIEHGSLEDHGTSDSEADAKRRLGRAINLFNQDRLEEAKPIFEEISRRHPGFDGSPQAIACLALISFKQKDFPKTVQYYQQLIEMYPGSHLVAEAYCHIGRSYEFLGDWGKAESAYRTAAERYPESEYGLIAAKRLEEKKARRHHLESG